MCDDHKRPKQGHWSQGTTRPDRCQLSKTAQVPCPQSLHHTRHWATLNTRTLPKSGNRFRLVFNSFFHIRCHLSSQSGSVYPTWRIDSYDRMVSTGRKWWYQRAGYSSMRSRIRVDIRRRRCQCHLRSYGQRWLQTHMSISRQGCWYVMFDNLTPVCFFECMGLF